jgi:DNA helicase HerA-like ATPase
LDNFVRRTVTSVFKAALGEEKELRLLLVYDEVHRLLPKYGGKGGYIAIERACREFRKWGIGVFMISQVLMDFRGAIRANIATEIQLRTKYEGDIGRVKTKYGMDYASKVVKLTTGTALVQNPAYNEGKPYFIAFRPLLHDTGRLSDEEIEKYVKVQQTIEGLEKQIEAMKARKVDTTDIEIEINLAKDKMKAGQFAMAESYIDSLKARLKA